MPRSPNQLAALLASAAISLALAACGGGDDGEAGATTRTTGFGTLIVGTVEPEAGLRVEVQGSALYVSFTDETADDVRSALQGRPMGAVCTLDDGEQIGTLPLYWRERSGDWGVNASVLRRWNDADGALAERVRSCELRRGVATGGPDGERDVAAGSAFATAVLREE